MKSRIVCLLSGGIDSPVAAHLMVKKGFDVILLHLNVTEESVGPVKRIARQLGKRARKKFKLFVGGHGGNLKEISGLCDKSIRCVLCKRMMYRVAEAFAEKHGAKAIVTGENLGQVASQTLKNLSTQSRAVKMPILRPLIGMEKNDIIRIAKDIGTYEISISSKERCPYVPSKPATAANLAEVQEEERVMEMGKLVKATLDSVKEFK